MLTKQSFISRNKSSVFLLVLALIVGGVSAQATGLLNTSSGGYLLCVNTKTKVVTHSGTSSCPKGHKKLVLGAQGVAGLSGADGRTLLNGIKDPESTVGTPGDMFINSDTKTLFGPKNLDGTWPAGVSMVGPQGPGGSGSVGPAGAAGAPGSNATLTCAQGGTCILGNTGPGGGIVFYVSTTPNTAATPWRYMEAAPNTWSGGVADPTMKWCSDTSNFLKLLTNGIAPDPTTGTTVTLDVIGSGIRNTKLMLGTCTFGAANMATGYNGGGKNDWFLPSKDELEQLYLQRANVGGFEALYYWSSSEKIALSAWGRSFNAGEGFTTKDTITHYVRPVRAF